MLHIDDDLIKILNNENLREKEESYLNKQGLPTLDISIDGLDESIKKVERECETGKEILMEIDIVLSCLYSKLGTITCSNNNYSNDQINIINDIVTKYESKREKIYEIFITKFNLKNDLENVKLELLKKYNNININNDINNYTDNNSIIPKIPIIPSTFSSYSAFSSDCNSKHCEDNNNNNNEYDNNGELYYPQDEIIGNNSLSNISYYNDYYHYNSSSDSKIYSDDDIGNIDDLKGIKELEEQEQSIEYLKQINSSKLGYMIREKDEYSDDLEEKLVSHLNIIDINSSINDNDSNKNHYNDHCYHQRYNNLGPCLPKQPLL